MATAFSGVGAKDRPGRWNQRGDLAAYGSTVPSLAYLEYLTTVDLDEVPDDVCLIQSDLPDGLVVTVDLRALPADWRSVPTSESSRDVGHRWLVEKRALALRVPSALLPPEVFAVESNVLVNPSHQSFATLQKPIALEVRADLRLFGRSSSWAGD